MALISDHALEEGAKALNRALGVIEALTTHILAKLNHMASELDNFISSQEAANTRISAAVEGVKGDVAGLKEQILQLIKDAPTAEQQEKLRALETAATGIAEKLEALDAETPAPAEASPSDPV